MEPVKKSEAPDYYEIIRFPIGEYASALQVSWKSGGLLALPGPHRALHVYILPLSSSSLLRITAVVSSSIKRNHVDLERWFGWNMHEPNPSERLTRKDTEHLIPDQM